MKIVYAQDAIVYTEGAVDFAGLIKQRLRWKRGRFETFLKYRSLFFSTDKKHNKVLSWIVLPLAVFGDMQLSFELFFIIFLYVYSYITNDFSSFISGIIIVSSMFIVQIISDENKKSWGNLIFLKKTNMNYPTIKKYIPQSPYIYLAFAVIAFLSWVFLYGSYSNSVQKVLPKGETNTSSYTNVDTSITTMTKPKPTPSQISSVKSSNVPETIKTPTTSLSKNVVENVQNNVAIPIVSFSPQNISNNTGYGDMKIMAWIYPGDPTCGVKKEYSDGRKIDVLKAEYFTISEDGELVLLTEGGSGCNGYSQGNVADLKRYSKEQYVTISSSYAVSMGQFLDKIAGGDSSDINTIVSFVADNNLTGVEIDFEDFGGWDSNIYSNYKKFINDLGNALHQNNKKLMIDGPVTSNQVEENWYAWRYSDFVSLPVDDIVVMTYDYQYDQGSGEPVSPISWIENSIKWTISKFPDKTKITFGIPSYGYKGTIGTQRFSLLTYDQIKKEPGFDTAVRDPESFEMTWQNEKNIYFYQDSESMSKKLQTIRGLGIRSVSVWHLGGNLWFNKN